MLRRGMGCLLVLAALLCTGPSWAQTKMTIATGVDPVFSAYYVAQQEGLFKKHGLDVRINTGPSGSAMVAFLVNGQIESAFGSEIAGVANHNLDPNVVVVAQATRLVRWIAVVGRNIDTLDQLKGKKVGIARGSGGEVFWLAMIDKLKLNPADYTVVNVEAPEMVAALERGNIDAYVVWEPWVTRGLAAIKNTKVLRTQEGILEQGVYVYMNRGLDPEEPHAGRGLHPRARGRHGPDQPRSQARGQGRVRLPQESRAGDGRAAHDQAHVRDGAERLHCQPVSAGRGPAQGAGQAREAAGLERLHLPGTDAEGAAGEGELQAVIGPGARAGSLVLRA